jgi:pimeloyl-ACP methyl ester carboxylesterase
VLDSLGIDRAVLVGLSLGGRIAVDFALTHPERVRGLVLAGPGLSGFPWSRQQEAVWTRIGEAVRRKDGRAAARLWLETGYMRPAMEHAALRPLLRRLTEENAASWTVPDEETELEPPAYDRLGSIQAPARIIVGARDIPDIHRIVDRLASGIPGATRVVVPRAGHMVNLEAPEAFERAVLPFIDSLPPSAAR